MTDVNPEEAAYELKRVATEEAALQSDLFSRWIVTLRDKPEIEVMGILSAKLSELAMELAVQKIKLSESMERLEAHPESESQDEDKMLRELVGAHVWMFKISESICAHAGKNLYHLIENTELHERIASFQKKPVVEN